MEVYSNGLTEYGQGSIDEGDSSVFVVATYGSFIYKIDTATLSLTPKVIISASTSTNFRIVPYRTNYIIGKSLIHLPIVSSLDFSVLASPAHSINYFTVFHPNSLNEDQLFAFSISNMMYSIDLAASTTTLVMNATLDTSGYGTYDELRDLGSLQYLWFVPANVDGSQILLLDKILFQVVNPFSILLPVVGQTVLAVSSSKEVITVGDYHYFSFLAKNTSSLTISYSYRVHVLHTDNCTMRSVSNTCTTCPPGTYTNDTSPNNVCLSPSDIPSGRGIDSLLFTVRPCGAGSQCLDCLLDYRSCSLCTDGYYLSEDRTQCLTTTFRTVFTSKCWRRSDEQNDDGSVEIGLFIDLLGETHGIKEDRVKRVMDEIRKRIGWMFEVKKLDGKGGWEVVDVKGNYFVKEDVVNRTTGVVIGRFEEGIFEEDQKYNIELKEVNLVGVQLTNGTIHEVFVYEGSCSYNKQTYSSQYHKKFTNYLKTGAAKILKFQDTNTVEGFSLVAFLLALDFSGAVFRVSRFLQIINRLYFLNTNYGPILGPFLLKSAQKLRHDPNTKRPQFVYNSKNYRGKLSDQKTTLDVVSFMKFKIGFYYISWIVKIVRHILIKSTKKIGKIGIYFCHFSGKFNLLAFNLFYLDFLLLSLRTLIHSRDMSFFKVLINYLTLLMVSFDLCTTILHLLDDRTWRTAYQTFISLKTLKSVKKSETILNRKSIQIVEKNPSKESNNERNTPDFRRNRIRIASPVIPLKAQPAKLMMKGFEVKEKPLEIDYKKSIKQIEMNIHLMEIAASHLKVSPEVFGSLTCRLLSTLIWTRIPVILIVLISCQNSNVIGIGILCSFEILRLIATLHLYLKLNHIRSKVLMVIEIVENVWMVSFLLNCYLLIFYSGDHSKFVFYQYFGIFSIVGLTILELCLLLYYEISRLFNWQKSTMKVKSAGLVVPKFHVVHYKVEETTQTKTKSPLDFTNNVQNRRNNLWKSKLFRKNLRIKPLNEFF